MDIAGLRDYSRKIQSMNTKDRAIMREYIALLTMRGDLHIKDNKVFRKMYFKDGMPKHLYNIIYHSYCINSISIEYREIASKHGL